MSMNFLEKAAAILSKCHLVTLAPSDETWYPHISILANENYDGISTLWVATWTSSIENAIFSENPNASILCYCDGNTITLNGRIQIICDSDIKKSLWQERYIQYFPQGMKDPQYCILRFDTFEANCWIDDRFETLQL